MIMQKKHQATKTAHHLHAVFQELDKDGDGRVTWEEFEVAFNSDNMVKTWLAALELEVNDVHELFVLLDKGDGEISYSEFIHGAKRMKGGSERRCVVSLAPAR